MYHKIEFLKNSYDPSQTVKKIVNTSYDPIRSLKSRIGPIYDLDPTLILAFALNPDPALILVLPSTLIPPLLGYPESVYLDRCVRCRVFKLSLRHPYDPI